MDLACLFILKVIFGRILCNFSAYIGYGLGKWGESKIPTSSVQLMLKRPAKSAWCVLGLKMKL